MAKYTGKDVVIKINTGSAMDALLCATNVGLEPQINLVESPCLGQSAKTRTPSVGDYSLDIELFINSADDAQALLLEGVTFDWEGYFEGTDNQGSRMYAGTAVVESKNISGAEPDGLVKVSIKAVNNASTGLETPISKITVFGAGDTFLNGDYLFTKTSGKFVFGDFSVYQAADKSWVLHNAGIGVDSYTNPATTDDPPKTGWVVAEGASPAPTISY